MFKSAAYPPLQKSPSNAGWATTILTTRTPHCKHVMARDHDRGVSNHATIHGIAMIADMHNVCF
jgi:hypothetical protein